MNDEILLEVGNIRISTEGMDVQLRADREPERPRWWRVNGMVDVDQFKAITDALEKKRPVLAKLVAHNEKTKTGLKVDAIIIQYAETTR